MVYYKLKLSSFGIELHVESPLPPEWQQCLDLQVCFILFFFLITYCIYLVFMVFLLLLSLNSPLVLFHPSSFFLITNCVSLLLMVSFIGNWIDEWLQIGKIYYYNWASKWRLGMVQEKHVQFLVVRLCSWTSKWIFKKRN